MHRPRDTASPRPSCPPQPKQKIAGMTVHAVRRLGEAIRLFKEN